MGFVERALLPGERITFNARLSAVPLLNAAINIAVGLAITIVGVHEPVVLVTGLVWFIVAIVSFFRVAFVLMTTTIVVTNQRLLGKTGFFSRSSVELLLTKLESVEVRQSLIGRIANYGNIGVHGTGARNVVFKYIKSPLNVRQACARSADLAQKSGPAQAVATPLQAPPSDAAPLFEVCVVDRRTGSERWVDVRAANTEHAKELAAATGALVGEARLKSIC